MLGTRCGETRGAACLIICLTILVVPRKVWTCTPCQICRFFPQEYNSDLSLGG